LCGLFIRGITSPEFSKNNQFIQTLTHEMAGDALRGWSLILF